MQWQIKFQLRKTQLPISEVRHSLRQKVAVERKRDGVCAVEDVAGARASF